MVMLHGAAYLTVKLEHGIVHDRARRYGTWAALASMALFALGGAYVAVGGLGFHITSVIDPGGASNPRRTVAAPWAGGWLANYASHPWMTAAPLLGVLGAAAALLGIRLRWKAAALAGSAASTAGIIATVGLSMFPFILPSTTDPHSSLTVWNASSSQSTLMLMLIVTVVFLPLVLLYTAWVYRMLWGRVTVAEVSSNPDFY